MSFAAREWEFRARFWLIAAIYWIGFFLYAFDHFNVCAAVARRFFRQGPDPSAAINHAITGLFAAGTVLAILGAAVRTWAGAYLHSSIIHDAALHGEQLVADGPYRHLRNPLYLGNILLAIGVGVLASRTGFAVIALGMPIFLYRLILREEMTLLASQADSYRRYCQAVPRLWPSITPRIPSGGARPNWADGFSGELFMWAAAAAMIVFTITQSIAYFWIVFGSGLAVYFLQNFLRVRAKKSAA